MKRSLTPAAEALSLQYASESDKTLRMAIRDVMTTILGRSRVFAVVERKNLDQVLAEMELEPEA